MAINSLHSAVNIQKICFNFPLVLEPGPNCVTEMGRLRESHFAYLCNRDNVAHFGD